MTSLTRLLHLIFTSLITCSRWSILSQNVVFVGMLIGRADGECHKGRVSCSFDRQNGRGFILQVPVQALAQLPDEHTGAHHHNDHLGQQDEVVTVKKSQLLLPLWRVFFSLWMNEWMNEDELYWVSLHSPSHSWCTVGGCKCKWLKRCTEGLNLKWTNKTIDRYLLLLAEKWWWCL